MGSALAAASERTVSEVGSVNEWLAWYAPAAASSFLGTGSLDFLSSSRRAGAMVRKSTPARALISPI